MLSSGTRRWIYYSSAIVTAILFLLLFTPRESRLTKLLSQKLKQLEKKYYSNLKSHYNLNVVLISYALIKLILL
jgi:uncharacterized membrane protein YozB (DUF420 family)